MSIQSWSALISLIVILLLAGIFLRVRFNARHREDFTPVQGRAYRLRAIGFGFLVLVGLPVSIWLLREHPYRAAEEMPQIVNVTSAQWYWDFDREEVITGTPVEFRVSSIDVNHGFGLYDPGGRLVVQVQAMPGYVNRLVHTFTEPGTYRVLCLEYCGLAHHDMEFDLIVRADEGGSNG